MRRVLMALALAALVAPGSAFASEADRDLQHALDDLVERAEGPPGVSAIVRDGSGGASWHRAGVGVVGTGRPFRRSDHMRIASTSKAFSGAAALALVRDGQLELDSTIGEVLPSLPAGWSAVTLAQLMQHTSGVPSYTSDPAFLAYFGANLRGDITPEAILTYVSNYNPPLNFTPGTDYAYSNSDNVVIGLMAEAVTGDDYRQVLKDLVFDPLGLDQTRLPESYTFSFPRIRGYDPVTLEEETTCCSMAFVWASGGLVSTPAELNRFGRAYIGRKLFGRTLQDQQFDWVEGGGSEPPGPGENSAGLGVFRYRTDCGTVYGHTGNFPGYTQFFAATRNGRRSVTVSTNSQYSETEHPQAFEDLRRIYELAVCAALD